MLSPVCRGRGLKRGSDESYIPTCPPLGPAQSRRRLWPFARRERESSTYVKKEQQLLEEDPMSHTTKRQGRREVRVATWGCGEPRPVDGQPGTLPPKLPRFFGPVTPKQPRFPRPPSPKQPWFNRQLTIFTRDLDYSAHVNQTGPEHLEAKEPEPKAPAQEQRRLLLSHRKSILRSRMRSWRHLHLQSFHHLQQPLQLQLWSQGRPQTKLRPQHRWRKNPPWSPCWLLPQRRSCLWRAQLKGRLLNVLTLSQGTTLFQTFSFSFLFLFCFYVLCAHWFSSDTQDPGLCCRLRPEYAFFVFAADSGQSLLPLSLLQTPESAVFVCTAAGVFQGAPEQGSPRRRSPAHKADTSRRLVRTRRPRHLEKQSCLRLGSWLLTQTRTLQPLGTENCYHSFRPTDNKNPDFPADFRESKSLSPSSQALIAP
ncbi:hypothetical protein QTO34_005539 [Cnephaeus nilssonii]|uniref:Uncharacterized protein n=1 Tax=Cnephaeus nilssonii TaxID=3371016 RepID=A0AA40HNL4_CNENI|nr:hypothetical protein QTO34_005539 [Eptesicus nilssonii]